MTTQNNSEQWYTEIHEGKFGQTFKIKDVLFSGQSDFQKVDVYDLEFFGKTLVLDGLMMTNERDEFVYHEMIAHIPMLSHPNPKRILVIGGGDGGTVREVLRHPSVEEVVLCEIDGMVIDACREHIPVIAGQLSDPRVTINVADGAAYIAEQKDAFDVILIDSTDPIGPGEGLFNDKFYTDVKEALTENGVMVNQSESPFSQEDAFVKVQRLLRRVFPVVKPYFTAVPTYPSSHWSWSFCSKGVTPFTDDAETRMAALEKVNRFTNRDVMRAVFALPNYMQALIHQAEISDKQTLEVKA